MSRKYKAGQDSNTARHTAANALQRGRRAEPGLQAKLRDWQCQDQAAMWSEEELNRDRWSKR